jgi:hypothetical protein
MVKIVHLDEVRKEKSDDAADWEVVDALKRALELVESGQLKATSCYLAFMIAEGDSLDRAHVTCAKSHLEILGILAQHMHDMASQGMAIIGVDEDGDDA